MKFNIYFLTFVFIVILFFSCGISSNKTGFNQKEKPVVIANDSLEYEIVIMDIGFNTYLNTIAQPRNFYTQSYLENRNYVWVLNWNIRFNNPQRFNQNIYENEIDYKRNIDYGYEVNYLLFNYFLFAQQKYNMSLGGGFRTNRIN